MKTLKQLSLLAITFFLFSSFKNGTEITVIKQSKITSPVDEKYKCLPCGQDCDKIEVGKSGKCAKCHMDLVKANSISFKNIEPTTICAYIKSHPKTILLDVRTKEEFEGKADPDFGTLRNSINIPINELKNRLSELNAFKNREILVFCSHSHRSPQASYLLTQNGFLQVKNMSGGMSVVTDKNCKK